MDPQKTKQIHQNQNSPPNPPKGTLCYAIVLPGRKSGFRPNFGRTATGKEPKSALRPAPGRRTDFQFFPGISLAKIRSGSPISGPEPLLRSIEYNASQGPGRIAALLGPIQEGGPGFNPGDHI